MLQAFWPRERGRAPAFGRGGDRRSDALRGSRRSSTPRATRSSPAPSSRCCSARSCSPTASGRRSRRAAVVVLVATRRGRRDRAARSTDPGAVDRLREARRGRREPRHDRSLRWNHNYAAARLAARRHSSCCGSRPRRACTGRPRCSTTFDGREWRRPELPPLEPDGESDRGHPEWFQTIHVDDQGPAQRAVHRRGRRRLDSRPRRPAAAAARRRHLRDRGAAAAPRRRPTAPASTRRARPRRAARAPGTDYPSHARSG